MTIDIIIPNFNGSNLLRENLPKVLAEVNKFNGGIIIVDDFSMFDDFAETENLVKEFQERGEKVTLLRNEKNFGFATTINRGVKASSADFIVLLNTDVVPEKDFLTAIVGQMIGDANLFGVGMMDKSIEGDSVVFRGRGVASWKRGFLVHERGDVDRDDTFWISGGSSIIRRESFVKVGGFETLYDPFYWEDIDLSYTARKSGFAIKFNKKSIVTHKHSEGAIAMNFSSSQVKLIAYRNQIIFVWKNISDFNLLFSHILWLPYHVAKAIISLDHLFLRALVLAMFKIPKIYERRRALSILWKKKDFEVLSR